MSMPFYVAPEQIMRDKAEYAKKGIAKGHSIVALEYQQGIVLAAENPSTSLNKISEIYDRIGFAGVGKYSEFENLRKAGVRYADTKGYLYSRADVTAKSLANAFSQTIGAIFTQEMKPLEIEILVVQVGLNHALNAMYNVLFDGSISDQKGFAVIGGQSDDIRIFLKERYQEQLPFPEAFRLCHAALRASGNQLLGLDNMEVAIMDRQVQGRIFQRLALHDMQGLLS